MNKDKEHLNLLKIFHYIVGGIASLFACLPLIHIVLGYLIATNQLSGNEGNQPPTEFGWLFVIMGALTFIVGQAASICILLSGRFIQKNEKYMFSFIVACIMCLFVPFGTALGVCCIIVLSRESVKELYEKKDNA